MTTKKTAGRGSVFLRSAVAAVAVLGVGGAITAAAFTHNTNIYASGVPGIVSLHTGETELPVDTFSNLAPGASRSVQVTFLNDGSLPAHLVDGIHTMHDADGAEANGTVSFTDPNPGVPLQPGDSRDVTLTISTGDDLEWSSYWGINWNIIGSAVR